MLRKTVLAAVVAFVGMGGVAYARTPQAKARDHTPRVKDRTPHVRGAQLGRRA
ncbi:MAG: hypothetical protein JF584_01760 [Acidobacteria bacterium]|nr:hypothetical protein [Acidobacteriota bacterium]